jgi:hypothetical protein
MQRASYRIVRMWRARQTEIVSCESDPVLTRSSATMKYGKSKHLRIPSAKPRPLQAVLLNSVLDVFFAIDSTCEVSARQHEWVPMLIVGPHRLPWKRGILLDRTRSVKPFWTHFIRPVERGQLPRMTGVFDSWTYSIGSPS